MMLMAHGSFGVCPLELAALVGGAGALWAIRFQVARWCRKVAAFVQGWR